jgi:hypothetical protein
MYPQYAYLKDTGEPCQEPDCCDGRNNLLREVVMACADN